MSTTDSPTAEREPQISTVVDAFGGTTTTIPAAMAKKQREIAALLSPDHECTGSGGISMGHDGSMTTYSRPCGGCVAQRERVQKQRPDLFQKAVFPAAPDSPTPEREPWRMKPEDALRLCDEFHLGQDVSLQMVCSAQTHTEAAVALGIVVPAAPDGAPPWTRQERADVAHAVALRAAQNGPARGYLRTLVEKVYAIPASRGDTTPLQSLAECELLAAPDGARRADVCPDGDHYINTCPDLLALRARDGADAGLDLHREPRFGCACGTHVSITYQGLHWFPAGHGEDACEPNAA